jgi:ferredoxin
MKIEVDRAVCVGHGKCYLVAPEVFAPGDELGRTKILRDVDPSDPDLLRRAKNAVDGCPEGALRFVSGT